MFSHVMIGTNDLEKSKRFYDAVLAVIGAKPGMVDRTKKYFEEVTHEMRKVTWPTRPELYGATTVVVFVCFVLTVVLGAADWVFGHLVTLFLGLCEDRRHRRRAHG